MTKHIADEVKPYTIDPKRHVAAGIPFVTGVNVPAQKNSGDILNYDIAYFDAESFSRYLRSKGGRNDLAEDILKKVLKYPLNGKPD